MSEWDEYEHEYNHPQEWSEASLRKMMEDVYWDMYYETYWEDIAPLKDQLKRLGYSPNDEPNLYSFRPQVTNGHFYKSIDDHKKPKIIIEDKYGGFLDSLHDKLCAADLLERLSKSKSDFRYAFNGIGKKEYELAWRNTKNLCPYLIDVLIDKRIIDGLERNNKNIQFIFGIKDAANLRNQYHNNSTGKPKKHQIIDDIVDSLL